MLRHYFLLNFSCSFNKEFCIEGLRKFLKIGDIFFSSARKRQLTTSSIILTSRVPSSVILSMLSISSGGMGYS